jgi:hypothetical protein
MLLVRITAAMDVDALRRATEKHLQDYAKLPEDSARRLVAAVAEAAQAELLGMISGGEPYPTSMSDLRALRLRYICQAAGRLLTTREVSVLFRTTDSGAQSLLTRMEVLYPAAVASYLDNLVAESGHWKLSGNADDPRYLIDFEDLGAWQHAIALLQDAGCTDLRRVRTSLTLEPPRNFPPPDGDDTRMLLGLPDKAERP